MRLDVFAQLHTLSQFQFDSQSLMPVVLCGQDALIDKILYHTSRPFASRVVAPFPPRAAAAQRHV